MAFWYTYLRCATFTKFEKTRMRLCETFHCSALSHGAIKLAQIYSCYRKYSVKISFISETFVGREKIVTSMITRSCVNDCTVHSIYQVQLLSSLTWYFLVSTTKCYSIFFCVYGLFPAIVHCNVWILRMCTVLHSAHAVYCWHYVKFLQSPHLLLLLFNSRLLLTFCRAYRVLIRNDLFSKLPSMRRIQVQRENKLSKFYIIILCILNSLHFFLNLYIL